VLILRRISNFAFPVALLLTIAATAHGQEAGADQAKALLKQGEAQYKALAFEAAKATFMKVDRQLLGGSEKKTLDNYLGKVDDAVRKQKAAMKAYDDAEKALKANQLIEAKQGYTTAAASEYLQAPMRKAARAQLALTKERIKRAAAVKLVPPEKPKPPVVEKPTPAPVAKPKPAPEEPKAVVAKPGKPDVSATTTTPAKPAEAVAKADQARLAKARELHVLGKSALAKNQYEQAAGYFQRALALAPELQDARQLLSYARKMAATDGEAPALSQLALQRRLGRQEADLKIDKAMRRSHEILVRPEMEAADFDAADAAVAVARNVLDAHKSLYSAREYRDKNVEIKNQLKFIAMKRTQWEEQEVQRQVEAISKANQLRQAKAIQQRQRKIYSLSERAKALKAERKYEQALEIVQQVLNLDPENRWAAENKDTLEQFVFLLQDRKTIETTQREIQRSLADVRISEIPWYELLRYPRDWREITIRRQPFGAGAAAESEENRLVRKRMQQKLQKLDFDDIEFRSVIEFLREVSGASIHVKWGALQQVGIDKTSPVNVHLSDVTFEKALKVILDDVGGVNELGYVVDEGVITISTKEDLATKTIVRVYDIRDMIVRVPMFTGSPRLDVSSIGQNRGGNNGGGFGGGGGLFDEDNDSNRGEQDIMTRREIIDAIKKLITDNIDPDSWRISGGAIGAISEMQGQLIVTQTAENQQALLGLINQLREARALQIAIEARFIEVSTGFLNSIGIDLDFYFNIGSGLGASTITDPFTGASVPQMGTSGWGAGKPGEGKLTPIGMKSGTFTTWSDVLGTSTSVASSIGADVTTPGLSVAGTFLDDIQVDFLIQATQAHEDSRSLTAPRITLFNGQRSYVSIATQTAYVTDLEPIVAENALAYNPVVSFIPSGTVLDVEATVSADRRYVTMTVRPQVLLLKGFTEYSISSATDPNGGTTSVGVIQLPEIVIQELKTTVSVPDGGTLLLGGQKLTGELQREKGVPLLSKIPIIKRAFTNRSMVRDEQTLLILIKPKIIIQAEEEERQFP